MIILPLIFNTFKLFYDSIAFVMGVISVFCVLSESDVNTVADSVPDEGLNCSFDEDTFTPDKVPDVALTNKGYLIAFVVVSSVIEPPLPVEP
jgi:hypothetical protein